ncbi:MAG: hypothetical protein ACLT8E_07220 [Akkermansia sp.]
MDLYSHDAATEGFIPVPNSAVVKVGVNDVVFIKAGNDTFVMKKVETLPSRQGKTPVKGLMPGQTIVTKGGYELKYILPTGDAGRRRRPGISMRTASSTKGNIDFQLNVIRERLIETGIDELSNFILPE